MLPSTTTLRHKSKSIFAGFLALFAASSFTADAFAGAAHSRDDEFFAAAARLMPAPALPAAVPVNPEDSQVLGQWGPILSWPHIAVSAANLPDGRILTFASNERTRFPSGPEFTYAATWDPATGEFIELNNENHDMFCAHLVMLADGRVFINGGRNTVRLTTTFDYTTNSWQAIDNMNDPRWYPTTVAMPDGEVVTFSGSGGRDTVERWDEGLGWQRLSIDWSSIANANGFESHWWPYTFLAPDGNIFHMGPTEEMHWIDPTGAGSMSSVNLNVPGAAYPKHAAVSFYEPGKVVIAGGAAIHADPGNSAGSTETAYTVDMNHATPVIDVIDPMIHPRRFANAVMLPNGEMLVVGGNTSGIKFNDTGTVLAPEIWNPQTGQWREVADMDVPRNYHSLALLLTDGRVLSAGGGLCGCSADHQDAQIYTPPYLFAADGSLAPRPSISAAPQTVGLSEDFSVAATSNAQSFSLIRMVATTHGLTTDSRFINVPFTEDTSGNYTLTAHDNPNVMTPGYWMLFVVDADGVPSVAHVLQVEPPIKVVNPGDQANGVGDTISLQIAVSNLDGDPVTFAATGLPGGLSIDTQTGLISGTINESGVFNISITATSGSDSDSAAFDWLIGLGQGNILRETWTGIGGTAVSNLTSDPSYPDNPDSSELLSSFEGPTNVANDYGSRISGYIHAPVTGNYTFWISSDDNGELWLSSDDKPENVTRIAHVPGWTQSRNWTKYPEQRSASINLVAGNRYYVEALYKERGGGDNLAVAWSYPGQAQTVIDGSFLSLYTPVNNNPPSIQSVADQTGAQYQTASLSINGSDPDGDSLTYSATGLPNGLSIGSATGSISGTFLSEGSFSVTVTVSDGSEQASESFSWTVSSGGLPPTGSIVRDWWLGIPGSSVSSLTSNSAYPDNPDGSELLTSFEGPTDWAENYGSRVYGFLYPPVSGDYTFWIATDDGSELWLSSDHDAANASLIASVPSWASPRQWDKFPEQQSATISLQAGQVYYIEVIHKEGAVLDNLAVAWQYPGQSQVVIDGAFLSPVGTLANQDPSIVNPGDQTSTESDVVNLSISASDPDGDSLIYGALNLPTGLSIDSNNGNISGTLSAAGVFAVSITVNDGNGGQDSASFTWTVDTLPPVNNPPSLTNPGAQSGFEGDSVNLALVASDLDGDSLTYGAGGLPAGLSINVTTGVISGTLQTAGTYPVTATVDDGNGGQDTASFTWTVDIVPPVNNPPSLVNPGDQNGQEGDPVNLALSASDPDGDTLTYGATGLPSGLSINASTGVVSGALQTQGTYSVTVSVNDGKGGQDSHSITWTVDPGVPVPNPPVLTNPGNQSGVEQDVVSLALIATDADGDPVTFSATGLPSSLSIDTATGVISGTLTTVGSFSVMVTVDDGTGLQDSETFNWNVTELQLPPELTNPGNQAGTAGSSINLPLVAVDPNGDPLTFSAAGLPSGLDIQTSSGIIFGEIVSLGSFTVTITVEDGNGLQDTQSFDWVVAPPVSGTLGSPVASSSIVYEERIGQNDRIWVANSDNDTVTAVDVVNDTKLAEIPVGDTPRSIALGIDGSLWVANQRSDSISIIDTDSLNVGATISLDYASQPFAIVVDPNTGDVFVSLSAAGLMLKFDLLGNLLDSEPVVQNLRSLSLNSDGSLLYATQFITIPQTGESGLNVNPLEGADVFKFDTQTLNLLTMISLGHNEVVDGHMNTRGIPNYLGPLVISPLGDSGWVSSKQDNIARGSGRDGMPLTHDSTVRSISSKIDLGSDSEAPNSRVDHDNGGIARAGAFGPLGNYLYVALEGSRDVVMVNVFASQPITAQVNRFDAGRAPQGIVISPDGNTVYVHNFMDRTVTKHDVTAARTSLFAAVPLLATYDLVSNEVLGAEILLGKKIFYDAADPRIALEEYISCASCHFDGEQDGRVWDLTSMGQGVRNTSTLRGKGGMAHGDLHWSANFDEVQDFEVQIRNLGGGTGLINGSVNDPLGSPNGGRSADLDALAAYVSSLTDTPPSPYRQSDGSLTTDGIAGKLIFEAENCAACHSGTTFTDSLTGAKHDIGTSGPGSGAALDAGVDTPTLLGVWATAPYLHNGSAATLEEAVLAHQGVNISNGDLDKLVAYLLQIDDSEAVVPTPKIQYGDVTVNQANSNTWHLLTFSESFATAPIVVMGPPSYNGSHQSTMRVRNVTKDGFEFQIDEWDYRDGYHTTETISYLAMDAGSHDLNGITALAGEVDVNQNWATATFSQAFSSEPIVLTQITTVNESSAATVRQRNTSNSSFQLMVEEEEASNGVHATETVHYIALTIGTGTLNGNPIRTANTGRVVDERWETVSFGSNYTNPNILANMQTTYGGDTAALRYRNLDSNSVEFLVEEEQSKNSEVGHTNEEVGWIVIGN